MTLTTVVLVAALAKAPTVAQAKPAKPPPASSSATMKELVRDVGSTGEAKAADGKEGDSKPAGPDVSKMPFTPESIKSVVAFYQPQIQGCYEETLAAKDKAIEGVLKTSFVITSEGLVKSAKVVKKGTTLKDTHLHDCVVSVVSTMQFPKPSDHKDHPIEYPFNLKAQH